MSQEQLRRLITPELPWFVLNCFRQSKFTEVSLQFLAHAFKWWPSVGLVTDLSDYIAVKDASAAAARLNRKDFFCLLNVWGLFIFFIYSFILPFLHEQNCRIPPAHNSPLRIWLYCFSLQYFPSKETCMLTSLLPPFIFCGVFDGPQIWRPVYYCKIKRFIFISSSCCFGVMKNI